MAASKVIVDKSSETPEWTLSSQIVEEKDDFVFIVGKETIMGNQRLSGCYEIASFDVRNRLIREMSESIKGEISQYMPDINENSESVFTKVATSKWNGKISGLQNESEYFERYRIKEANSKNAIERINCFVRSKISKGDYNKLKMSYLNELKEADPKIKEAIANKQLNFFKE